jgi:RNA polymerase sigma-70 factor (ECF subfamily)
VNAVTTIGPDRRNATHAVRRSFAAAARDHLDAVYRYLLTMTKDATLAEDLTSETFERALRRWHRFDPRRAGERTWLLMLARSATLDHFRAEERRRRREERYAREQEPEQPVLRVDLGLSPALEHALAELSAAEREVIALRVMLELEGDAAARVLGISRTSCSTRLSRALRKLEERVNAHVAV